MFLKVHVHSILLNLADKSKAKQGNDSGNGGISKIEHWVGNVCHLSQNITYFFISANVQIWLIKIYF